MLKSSNMCRCCYYGLLGFSSLKYVCVGVRERKRERESVCVRELAYERGEGERLLSQWITRSNLTEYFKVCELMLLSGHNLQSYYKWGAAKVFRYDVSKKSIGDGFCFNF